MKVVVGSRWIPWPLGQSAAPMEGRERRGVEEDSWVPGLEMTTTDQRKLLSPSVPPEHQLCSVLCPFIGS